MDWRIFGIWYLLDKCLLWSLSCFALPSLVVLRTCVCGFSAILFSLPIFLRRPILNFHCKANGFIPRTPGWVKYSQRKKKIPKLSWCSLIVYVFNVAPQIWNIGRCLQFKLRGVAICAKAFFISLSRVEPLAVWHPQSVSQNPTCIYNFNLE